MGVHILLLGLVTEELKCCKLNNTNADVHIINYQDPLRDNMFKRK